MVTLLFGLTACASSGSNQQLEQAVVRLQTGLGASGAPRPGKRRTTRNGARSQLPVAEELRSELNEGLWGDEKTRSAFVQSVSELQATHETAELFLAPGVGAQAAKSAQGWRLTSNPLDLYRSDTPRAALLAFVWASKHGRWSTLLALAPARFRAVFTVEELRTSWTDGPGSGERRALRDEIAASLDRVILEGSDAALLVTDTGKRVRLEREASRWVVAGY